MKIAKATGKTLQKIVKKHKKPKLMRGGGGKGLSISPGALAALGGLAYLFFGNKKKSK